MPLKHCHTTKHITPLSSSLFIESLQTPAIPRQNCPAISTSNKNFVQNTMSQTLHTQFVNIGDSNYQSGNITGSFNTTFYKSDEDAQIMRWLSPLEPNNRHHGVRNDRFAGVGDWLLQTRGFQEWRRGKGGADKAVLFCSGGPGVGKTYIR